MEQPNHHCAQNYESAMLLLLLRAGRDYRNCSPKEVAPGPRGSGDADNGSSWCVPGGDLPFCDANETVAGMRNEAEMIVAIDGSSEDQELPEEMLSSRGWVD
jgi:hypothetical protein